MSDVAMPTYSQNEASQEPVRAERTQAEAAKSFKLRDLAAAYKDLTADMQIAGDSDIEDLSPLVELLR
jgi:hypothetical protein